MEQKRNLKMLTDISNLPDVGDVSINKTNTFEMKMDDKHKAELTEYGKDIKTRYSDSESGEEQIDTINIISLSKNTYDAYLKKIGGDYETYKDGAILIDNNINTDEKGKKIQGSIYTWKEPVTEQMIENEIVQVKQTGLECYKYGFFSKSGFACEERENRSLIELKELYR